MPNITTTGYLEGQYLEEGYLSSRVQHGVRSQVTLTVASTHPVNSQVARTTAGANDVQSQVDRKILEISHPVNTELKIGKNAHLQCNGYLESPYLEDPYLAPYVCVTVRSQVDRRSDVAHEIKSQVERLIVNIPKAIKSQVERRVDSARLIKSQIARTINFNHEVLSQVARFIVDIPNVIKSQTERRIDSTHPVNSQVLRISAHPVKSQVNQILYNTTNLRIMCDFPSRGTSGTNWSSNSTMTGDFSVNNLNTDIVEQVWRSNNITSGVQLVSDSELPQGVFIDTVAFLNHNLTTSASVTWQSSDDPGFASIPFTEVLSMTTENFYWIAEAAPLTAYRYHRFLISDPTNSSPYLEIGTIVYGPTVIFQGECFVDQVRRRTKHFSDKIETEGFTNVSNDRVVKYAVGLEFRSLNFNKGNYTKMRSVFDYARTSLKCLWIPTPQFPGRFATFAKLESIPEETHNVKGEDADYVDFSILTDESL